MHNLNLPVTQNMSDMYSLLDVPATMNCLLKTAVEQALLTKLMDARRHKKNLKSPIYVTLYSRALTYQSLLQPAAKFVCAGAAGAPYNEQRADSGGGAAVATLHACGAQECRDARWSRGPVRRKGGVDA